MAAPLRVVKKEILDEDSAGSAAGAEALPSAAAEGQRGRKRKEFE